MYQLNKMNSATTLYTNSVQYSNASSLYFSQLTGTISSLAQSATSNFTLSGFNTYYTSTNSGQGVTLPPGGYEVNISVSFTQPVNGTSGSFCTISFNTTGTNSITNPSSMQTNGVLNGWQTNYGVGLYALSNILLPSGGTLTPALLNSCGGSITNVALKMIIKQTTTY